MAFFDRMKDSLTTAGSGSFSEGEECNGECQIGKFDQEQ